MFLRSPIREGIKNISGEESIFPFGIHETLCNCTILEILALANTWWTWLSIFMLRNILGFRFVWHFGSHLFTVPGSFCFTVPFQFSPFICPSFCSSCWIYIPSLIDLFWNWRTSEPGKSSTEIDGHQEIIKNSLPSSSSTSMSEQ